MPNSFPHLFSPLPLRHKTLKSRLVFGAHTANMAESGLPAERHLAYYRDRAEGGAAMIVVEPVPVDRHAVLTRGNFRHGDDAIIAPFRRITDACHAHDVVMIHQLYHVGQHGDWDNSFEVYPSPSGLASFHDGSGSAAMSQALIEQTIASFVAAAGRARQAGFDGIELFAAYNALIDQFWAPFTNRRDDRWGGSLENRSRFSRLIMEGIRQQCGEDFIIGLAVSLDPAAPAMPSAAALSEVLAWHDSRGLMDYVTCGHGSYFTSGGIIPSFLYEDQLGAPFAAELRKSLKHARMQAEASIRTPAAAEALIGSGGADMVSIVRGQIADPALGNKAREGRPEDIRPCISCNTQCRGRRQRDYWISCLVNPAVGREGAWRHAAITRPADRSKRVLVVGAGPAGLEAAMVAAERGHQVTLMEAASQIGGQWRLAGLQPRRGQILEHLAWYETRLAKLQVKLELDRRVDPASIQEGAFDAVIVATGSLPAATGFQRVLAPRDRMPGVELSGVLAPEDVMAGTATAGDRVIVLDEDGSWRGAGTAWHLANAGHEVTIVTPQSRIAAKIGASAGDGKVRAALKRLGVVFRTESALEAWHGDGATVRDLLAGSNEVIAADTLVLATLNAPHDPLSAMLAARGIAASVIGDGLAAREAHIAIYEGRRAAMAL